MKTAITKSPKQMIDLLIKDIKLYNDKIEIYFKYNKKSETSNISEIIHSDNQTILIGYPQKKINLTINCVI